MSDWLSGLGANPTSSDCLAIFGIGLGLSLLFTFATRTIAKRVGFVSKPRVTRWNTRTVSLGGGIGLISAALIGILLIGGPTTVSLAPAVALVFALGLFDDIRAVSPPVKLVGQAIAAAYVANQGYLLPFSFPVMAIALSITWVIGMSNSINMLDNMDGLASGVAMVAAAGLGFLLFLGGDVPHAMVAFSLAGACLGFLVFNFNPASIFMGDAGSLPLGLLLAALATKVKFPQFLPESTTWLLAVLVLIVPLFDTMLVMIARGNARRPLMMGGRDHSSHRLVQLGLSEKRAVLVLYALGALGSALAWFLSRYTLPVIFCSIAFLIGVILFGLFLLEVNVKYPSMSEGIATEQSRKWRFRKTLPAGHYTLPVPLLYFMEIFLDICVISLVWMLAHLIRFQDTEGSATFSYYLTHSVIPRLPALIMVKLVCFAIFRLYRGVWQSVSSRDVYQIFKAVTLSTVILVLVSTIRTRMVDLSRFVVVLDWLMTFVAVLGIRGAMSAFRRWSIKLARAPYKAAFVGSPELLAEIRESIPTQKSIQLKGLIVPTGLTLNPDRLSLPVLGNRSSLDSVLEEHKIDMLLVLSNSKDEEMYTIVANRGVIVRRIRLELE